MPIISNAFRAFARPAAALAIAAAALAASGADLVPVSKIEPEFPREALSADIDSGKVHAKMTIDASGEVSRVEIMEATPRRVFDRAVVRALSQWRFAPGAAGRTMEIDIVFHS